MVDTEPFKEMLMNGEHPEAVYARAKIKHGDELSDLLFLRQVFDVSLSEAREIIQRGEDYIFKHYVLPDYQAMAENGIEPEDIFLAASEDTRLDTAGCFRILRAVCYLSLVDARRVSLTARSRND